MAYNAGKLCVDVSGQNKETIDAARNTLETLTHQIQATSISVESHVRQFLSSGTRIEQLNASLASKHIVAHALEVDHTGLKILAKEGEVGKVQDEVRKWLLSPTIEIDDDETRKYLVSQTCHKFFTTLQDELGIKITCVKGVNGIVEHIAITAQRDQAVAAKRNIEDHLYANVQTSESRPLPNHAVAEFLQRHMDSEIKEIEKKLISYQATVEILRDVTPPVIVLKSKKAGFLALSKHVGALLSKCTGVASKEFKKHGLKKLVQNSFSIIQLPIERDRKVVITAREDGLRSHLHSALAGQTRAKQLSKHCCTKNSNHNIVLYSGDICHHPVDVIVSTANEDLDFSAGLPAYLVKCGGDTIKKECEDYLSKKIFKKKLGVGDVICTSAGCLSTTHHVIHVVGPRWPQGAAANSNQVQTTTKLLKKAVNAALDKAASLGCSSVALPAVSAGGFGCPSDFVAQHMVETIDEFLASRQSKQLHDVHIVLLETDQHNIKAFQVHMMNKLGKVGQMPPPQQKRQPPPPPPPQQKRKPPPPPPYANTTAGAAGRSKPELKVVIMQGDISSQQVNLEMYLLKLFNYIYMYILLFQVDVIVSSACDTLNLQSAQASKALAQKAGPALQQACSAYVKQHGSLKHGDIVVTGGYKLHCKHIAHAFCPRSRPVSLLTFQ